MKCVLGNTKVERIMYSVDYPFESNEKDREWFEHDDIHPAYAGNGCE